MERREIEVKLKAEDPVQLLRRMRALGASLHRRRHFEDNYILDTPSHALRRRRSLLRVRLGGGRSLLTFKGPGRIVKGTKARNEIETGVADGDTLRTILERLGFRVTFRYQKFRTTFRHGSLLITLDETPIGTYLEIEGSRTALGQMAKRLGYRRADFISKTYHELFMEYRQVNRLSTRNMVFGIER